MPNKWQPVLTYDGLTLNMLTLAVDIHQDRYDPGTVIAKGFIRDLRVNIDFFFRERLGFEAPFALQVGSAVLISEAVMLEVYDATLSAHGLAFTATFKSEPVGAPFRWIIASE